MVWEGEMARKPIFPTPPPPSLVAVPGRSLGGKPVGQSAAGAPRGGSVGTPTYIPQNDPHDALIILNIHKWGKNFFQKKFSR